jgi:hypothetical protein
MSRWFRVPKVQTEVKYGAIQWLMLLGVVLGVVTAIRFFWTHAS